MSHVPSPRVSGRGTEQNRASARTSQCESHLPTGTCWLPLADAIQVPPSVQLRRSARFQPVSDTIDRWNINKNMTRFRPGFLLKHTPISRAVTIVTFSPAQRILNEYYCKILAFGDVWFGDFLELSSDKHIDISRQFIILLFRLCFRNWSLKIRIGKNWYETNLWHSLCIYVYFSTLKKLNKDSVTRMKIYKGM